MLAALITKREKKKKKDEEKKRKKRKAVVVYDAFIPNALTVTLTICSTKSPYNLY